MVVPLQDLYDFVVMCILEDGKVAHAVPESEVGEWPASWHVSSAPDMATRVLAGPGVDFDASTPEIATFTVRNDPVQVLGFLGYLRWTAAQHKPVLAAAEQGNETIPMMVCRIDGEECEPLLRMAQLFDRRPGFKREWRVQ
ncbi:hypothetical protein KDK95_05640 [Actinospica sp. MGRD01-02]|uniref:Uncharacterized protein n=1 Tax=Actinospica acidithermotolerans TaxID=2828514 RepID=A0A941E7A6_9ACTN|nr:DUF6221 family protein [Actinospica acidithermotolerans]MBR7825782.1 hypothetical protein [Actinospica acidithermotolerans]